MAGSSAEAHSAAHSGGSVMDDEFWDHWLKVLILMHEIGAVTYEEFIGCVFESWRDACIRIDHARMVARLMGA
jgi:hypothetical protein